jgi:hypothetical protein
LIAWRREIRANFLHHSNSRSDVWNIEHDPFPTEIRSFHAALGRHRGPDWPVRSRSKVRHPVGVGVRDLCLGRVLFGSACRKYNGPAQPAIRRTRYYPHPHRRSRCSFCRIPIKTRRGSKENDITQRLHGTAFWSSDIPAVLARRSEEDGRLRLDESGNPRTSLPQSPSLLPAMLPGSPDTHSPSTADS